MRNNVAVKFPRMRGTYKRCLLALQRHTQPCYIFPMLERGKSYGAWRKVSLGTTKEWSSSFSQEPLEFNQNLILDLLRSLIGTSRSFRIFFSEMSYTDISILSKYFLLLNFLLHSTRSHKKFFIILKKSFFRSGQC